MKISVSFVTALCLLFLLCISSDATPAKRKSGKSGGSATAAAEAAVKPAQKVTTPTPALIEPEVPDNSTETEDDDDDDDDDDDEGKKEPYYEPYVEQPPPKPTGFEESFTHIVKHFAGNDDDVEEELPPRREDAPYKHTSKWKKGWKRYPLFLVIIGG